MTIRDLVHFHDFLRFYSYSWLFETFWDFVQFSWLLWEFIQVSRLLIWEFIQVSNLCALQKLAFCKWTTSCGAIPKRYQITLTDLFLDCAQLVEWPPDLNSNSHFQKTSKDTSFSPAPDQLILTNTYLFYLIKKIPSYVYCARLTETCHGTCILLLSRWSDCFYCSPDLYVTLDKSVC